MHEPSAQLGEILRFRIVRYLRVLLDLLQHDTRRMRLSRWWRILWRQCPSAVRLRVPTRETGEIGPKLARAGEEPALAARAALADLVRLERLRGVASHDQTDSCASHSPASSDDSLNAVLNRHRA